jgi:hypothetical protein
MTHVNIPRFLSLAVAGSMALTLAACGDDSQTASGSTVPTPSTPGTTAPGTGEIEHPVGADEVVLRVGYEGGFVPAETAFQNLPTVLVTGGGRLIVPGPMIEIYPGPLVPNLQVRTISEAGIQQLLALAAEHGLLTQRQYENPTNIADAPDTVVTIAANGEVYEHRAYALGLDGAEHDELRQALADFVAAVTGEFLVDNPELGAEQPYTSDMFLVRPTIVTDLTGYEIEPTVTDWPADLAPLVDGQCVEVPASAVGAMFAEANQLTFFTSAGHQFSLAVKPQLAGDSC